MAEATVYVDDHEINVEFEVEVYEDGIGPYEWQGYPGYDHGKLVKELKEITYCEIERSGWVDRMEDVPAFAHVIAEKDGKYLWSHARKIEANDAIIREVNDYIDWMDWDEIIDDQEYEAQMAQQERAMWSEEW